MSVTHKPPAVNLLSTSLLCSSMTVRETLGVLSLMKVVLSMVGLWIATSTGLL